ncbi:MAG TPA: hypothetical protein VNK67_14995 [Burkholderiales bacterium]|nr:hypothetical protein [Burkholderiales bacterium]
MLRAAALIEQLGIPTASIVASGFLRQAEVVKSGLGFALALAEYPGAPMVDSDEELRRKVEATLAPGIVRALTQGAPARSPAHEEPEPGSVVFSGTLDEVQEYFDRRLWSDGLPVIPPTRDRVERFLRFCGRDPAEVLGVVPQEGREATVLSVAVNGVMAGCRPEYMPLLVAIVEAMCDPRFALEHAGSTPGWEPLVIVNGPLVKALDFNYGQGVMRVGRRANTSVGRFVRLYLRNLCGYRIPPGAGDKGSIGMSFNVALAEDEDTARAIGWPTFAEERGFAPDENVVTVQSVVVITPPTYSAGDRAEDHVRQFAEVMGASFAYWSHTGMKRGFWHPLIVVGPSIARVIAREWSKDDVRRYLWENVKITAGRATHYARMTSTPTFSLERLVAEGVLPAEYAESDDPQRLVRVFIRPEHTGIVVAGDPGRNQSRGYMGNHDQGPPVSRRVALPSGWHALLESARSIR